MKLKKNILLYRTKVDYRWRSICVGLIFSWLLLTFLHIHLTIFEINSFIIIIIAHWITSIKKVGKTHMGFRTKFYFLIFIIGSWSCYWDLLLFQSNHCHLERESVGCMSSSIVQYNLLEKDSIVFWVWNS